MEAILESSCGLDVHKDKIEACILKKDEETAERERFGCISEELDRLCEWLNSHGCLDVAMESTGVYWLPIYERIEEKCAGIRSLLVVNAYEVKNLPGRKTDVKDAEWLSEMLLHGLLHNSFIPEKIVRNMREISRLRRKVTEARTDAINHLEKHLQRHGFKFSSVFSSLTGISSFTLLSILAERGEITRRDIQNSCTSKRLRHPPEEIYSAVYGKLDERDRRVLSFLLKQLKEFDRQIGDLTEMLKDLFDEYMPQIDIATSIPGISRDSAMEILAEISPMPQKAFSSPEKLCKWAGLSPRNDESADKFKSKKILHGNPYVKSILVQCAWAAVKCRKSQFKEWFWPRQCRLGRKKAIIAVARKLLYLLYTLLFRGEFYQPPIPAGAA